MQSTAAKLTAACLAAALTTFASCSREQPRRPPHVFVLIIDTLRTDRVGCYGGGRHVTPNLDRLAKRGNVFHNAYAASSWTNPSVASLFTSRFPSQHGVTAFRSVLADSEQTVAETLRTSGYATAGFVANLLINAGLGFGQGFERYEVYYTGRIKERARRLNAEALAWIDARRADAPDQPFFVYLHYMEPHEPLQPPSAALRRLARQRGWSPDHVETLERLAQSAPVLEDMDRATVALAEDLYDAEVASVDASIGRLFADLEQRGLLRDSVVVVSSDHGEEFFDHGSVGHGHTLYEELVRIPLLIAMPEQDDRVDIDEEVALVDLAPTILDLAGVAAPPRFEGRSRKADLDASLLRRWSVRVDALFRPGRAYSELSDFGATPERPKVHARALVTGGAKVIEHRDGEIEDYDLAADPRERDSGALGASRRRALTVDLEAMRRRLEKDRSPAETRALDEETRERLRALGYGAEE